MLTDTTDAMWTLTERAAVLERFRALADHADEELFVLLTTDGLVPADSLVHLRAATDRGVLVGVGSPHERVRERLQRAVPDAVVWEPRRDWFDPASRREGRLGRLVIADRQAAMLSTLDDSEGRTETAITGDGESNGLVVVLRNLVGSRLDQFDRLDAESQSPSSP